MTTCTFVMRAASVATPSTDARYEYRVWPRRAPPIVPALQRGWLPTAAERRADIYLLCPNSSNVTVKLRDGCKLEIKQRGHDYGDLAHWRVALSENFPLSPSALGQLASALLMPQSLPQTACLSPAHLLAALSRPSAGPEILIVRKSRLSFRRQGCRAEITCVVWENHVCLTIALEDADPDQARRAVNALGLGRWPNRSYGDALRTRPLLIMAPIQPHDI